MDFTEIKKEIAQNMSPHQSRIEIMDDIYEFESKKSIKKLENAIKFIKSDRQGGKLKEKFNKAELEYNRLVHNIEIEDRKNKNQWIINKFNTEMREKILKHKIEQELAKKNEPIEGLLSKVGPKFSTNLGLSFLNFKKSMVKSSELYLLRMNKKQSK